MHTLHDNYDINIDVIKLIIKHIKTSSYKRGCFVRHKIMKGLELSEQYYERVRITTSGLLNIRGSSTDCLSNPRLTNN